MSAGGGAAEAGAGAAGSGAAEAGTAEAGTAAQAGTAEAGTAAQAGTADHPGAAASLPAELVAAATAWIAADPDETTRSELQSLLDNEDAVALRARFDEPLQFGTAGLRAPLGAGPARMNRLVVRRTTAGVARWLLDRRDGSAEAGLVVGRDARHGSQQFSADVVEVAGAMGVRVLVLPQPLPTPLTAFAVRHFGAAAGVMITASHNPAPDNGYKVYASDGAQIVPPDDGLIAEASAAGEPPPAGAAAAPGLVVEIERGALLEAYAETISAVLDPSGARALRIVYTPVHGVGGLVLPGLLERFGFEPPVLVASQALPDPDFPTAPFPNPEEPGVLDPALAEAATAVADIVIANDPDADRLAVAIADPAADGGWRALSGDDFGALLGWRLLKKRPAAPGVPDHLDGPAAEHHDGPAVVATSIVSSSLLSKLAAELGASYVETLTGFKWIARAADHVPGGWLLFGYEEALGYAVCSAVRDKDGLSAALVVAELAAEARAAGGSLLGQLDELAEHFGPHLTGQVSLRLDGPGAHGRMLAVVDDWRSSPPDRLGGLAVVEVVDLERGGGGLPPTPGLLLRLAGSAPSLLSGRVVLRPSGTEPKLKAYVEVVAPPGCSRDASTAIEELRADVATALGA